MGFPGGSNGKASACNAGDPGLIPGSGRSSGKGNGNPLQYSCLGNPMDRGSCCPRDHEELDMTEWLKRPQLRCAGPGSTVPVAVSQPAASVDGCGLGGD